MQEDSNILVDSAAQFNKSLKELRDFSSQLYNAASHCEKSFLQAEASDKRIVVENTKEYVSRAVVTFVDHLGGVTANLEYCLTKTNSIPQAEHKLDILSLRIVACLQQSHKHALAEFSMPPEFSRHHCRYILPPLRDSAAAAAANGISRDTESSNEAKSEKENQFETDEPLFLCTYNCKASLVEIATRDMEKKDGNSSTVLPVRDGYSILPKAEHSTFKFQEAQRLKRSVVIRKLVQNKDIPSLIRRGKRVLA